MNRTSIQNRFQSSGLLPPKTLTIAITGRCNLACTHCWVEAGEHPAAGHVPQDLLFKLLKDHAAIGGTGIRLTGGEPLCHPGCLPLLAYADALGFRQILLQTNGILISDTVVDELLRLGISALGLEISLDGVHADTHDRIRGTGSYRRTVKAMERLHKAGLSGCTSILFTEMNHNLEEFPDLLERAEHHGIPKVISGTLIAGGRAASGAKLTMPSLANYLSLIDRFRNDRAFRERYERIGTMTALEWLKGDTACAAACCSFADAPYVTWDGTLYPCRLCHCTNHSVSDIHAKGLVASLCEALPRWVELNTLHSARVQLNPLCRECPGQNTCAAGCMGRALGSFGDIMRPDDRCDIRRHLYSLKKLPEEDQSPA